MPFSATCPGCGDERTVPDEGAGKRVRCRACGAAFWAGNEFVEVVDDADGPPVRQSRSRDEDRDPPRRRDGGARRTNPLPFVLGGIAVLVVLGGLAISIAFLGPFGSRRTEPAPNAGGPPAGGAAP